MECRPWQACRYILETRSTTASGRELPEYAGHGRASGRRHGHSCQLRTHTEVRAFLYVCYVPCQLLVGSLMGCEITGCLRMKALGGECPLAIMALKRACSGLSLVTSSIVAGLLLGCRGNIWPCRILDSVVLSSRFDST